MIIILMGVSGAGKTTIGQMLAKDLGWKFFDGDDFHPQVNIDKMREGGPLTDADRAPWLMALRELTTDLINLKHSAVIACSALKSAYREVLLVNKSKVCLIYLKGSPSLIRGRLQKRTNHYMTTDLLTSQFDALEEPGNVLTIDVEPSPEEIVSQIKMKFRFQYGSLVAPFSL